ncbi:MAG: hypothetical protein PV353_11050, partial [Bartonella sp.]|nr:hypothetical protein [Bartonella sp.]
MNTITDNMKKFAIKRSQIPHPFKYYSLKKKFLSLPLCSKRQIRSYQTIDIMKKAIKIITIH